MKKFALLVLLVGMSSMSCTAAHAHDYGHIHHSDHYDTPTTRFVVYDYAYDYYYDEWVRVNTYVDNVNCLKARRVIRNIQSNGFYVSVNGPMSCPSLVKYSVYHHTLYAPWESYRVWDGHHYAYHHHGVHVTFHYRTAFNTKHRFSGFNVRYQAHHGHRKYMASKYRVWKHKKKYKKYHNQSPRKRYKRYNNRHNNRYNKPSYKKRGGKKGKRGNRGKRHHRKSRRR